MATSMREPARSADDSFYASVNVFDSFDKVAEPALYRPLPDGWIVGNADIVQSTQAKAQGRAKAVNIAGAAVIAGVTNGQLSNAAQLVPSPVSGTARKSL